MTSTNDFNPRVGDRVRTTRTYDSGNTAVFEYTVTRVHDDLDWWDSAELYFDATHPMDTHEIISRAPVPEPKGLGAVVRVDDLTFVRGDLTGAPWWSVDTGWVNWGDFSPATDLEILSEGVEL